MHIFLLAFLFSLRASAYEVLASGAERILFSSNNAECKTIDRDLSELMSWYQQVDGKTCERPAIKSDKTFRCAAQIEGCLPGYVRKYLGRKSNVEGPNCWNSALVLSHLVPSFRESTGEEIAFYMSSPLCTVVDPSKLVAGDIGVMRAQIKDSSKELEVHAFIHISDHLVIGKEDRGETSSFGVRTIEQDTSNQTGVLGLFEECGSGKCSLRTDYFRCQTWDEYINYRGLSVPKHRILDQAEGCLEGLITQAGPMNSSQISDLKKILDVAETQLKPSSSSEKSFVMRALRLRIDMARLQLSRVEKNESAKKDEGAMVKWSREYSEQDRLQRNKELSQLFR